MNDVSKKSLGELIDALITTNIKCFGAQEIICNSKDDLEVANSARAAQKLNKRRNDLMRAIDARLGDGEISPTEKTYK